MSVCREPGRQPPPNFVTLALLSNYDRTPGNVASLQSQSAISMAQKSFLIVEDDIESCKILNIVLADYDLTVVHTLASAKPHYQARHFDIFMLDNWLPDGSGIDFCREIRTSLPDIPIIFTSAAAHEENIREATDAGASKYLVKPYDPFELQEIVKDLLNASAMRLNAPG